MDKFGAIYGWLENSRALQKYDQVGVQQQVSISRETQLFCFLINFTSLRKITSGMSSIIVKFCPY